MEDGFYGLPITVESEDGNTYYIEPFQATKESIDYLWEKAGKYSFLFSDITREDRNRFDQAVLSPGTILLTVFQKDDPGRKAVGVVLADKITPKWDANVHYIFWDKIQKGRHRVLLVALSWLMEELDLKRVTAEIMEYAYAGLRRAKHLGFLLEGRKRDATIWRGDTADVFLFGVLREELVNTNAIANCYIERTPEEASWFGLLDDKYALAHAMTKER